MSDSKYEIVKFVDGNIELNVNVSPEENTIWLNQRQMAILFNVNTQAITKQLKNIYMNDELDFSSTCSILEQVENEGGRLIKRKIKYYNLDILIFLGFKINSRQAVVFRKWANQVLKEYLLKGYVINKDRTLVTSENFNNVLVVVNDLKSNQIEMNTRLSNVEDKIKDKEIKPNKIFYNGEFYDAYSLIQSIFEKANKEIIIIDNYIDRTILDRLIVKKSGVNVNIYTSINSKLLGSDIKIFNKQYGLLSVIYTTKVHDRYIIIDQKELYHLGHSIKDLGSKIFSISLSDSELIEELLKNIK